MFYRVIAELCVALHFLWILFVIFGIVFALKGSKVAWLHLAGLMFSLVLNVLGWYCPLTYLENYIRLSGGASGTYTHSFILHYLEPLIYPQLPERLIRAGGIVFVGLNLVVYGIIARKYLREGKHCA